MTRPLVPVLAILLALQLCVTVVLYWPGWSGQDSSRAVAAPLLDPALASDVDGLRVSNGNDDSVALLRGDDGWQLAESGLPAAPGRVRELLDALAAEPGWPVARSEAARARFRVAADAFERRIELLDGDEVLATLYLGSAPGFRKVHARAAGAEAIYSITLNAYDAPADAGGWLDRSLLAVSEPVGIAWAGYTLQRDGDGWTANGGIDSGAAPALAEVLETLQVTRPATPAQGERASGLDAAATLTVTPATGESRALRLVEIDEERLIYDGARDRWFALSRYDYDRFLDALAALQPEAEAPDGEAASAPEGMTGEGGDARP